ncbi:putative ABM domain-containing protein [Seiridium cardinale]|uniref:ABM domain-containing protein n=1 Tax=Seiridium cardinale TaxID=138064 RepID=A0ABR2XQW8_9PEZI
MGSVLYRRRHRRDSSASGGISTTCFEERLQGRVTLTAFAIPDTDVPKNESSTSSLYSTFRQFVPNDCEDLPVKEKVSRMQSWTAWAMLDAEDSWADNQLSRQGQQVAPIGKQRGQEIDYEFRRWGGYGGTTQEREEASARSPEARKSWAQAVAKVVPSVTT